MISYFLPSGGYEMKVRRKTRHKKETHSILPFRYLQAHDNWGERERAPSCGLNGRAVTIEDIFGASVSESHLGSSTRRLSVYI